MLNPTPTQPISWRDPRLRSAYLVLAVAALLGLATLSRVMINSDEYLYAGQARIILDGRLIPVVGDPFPSDHPANDLEGARYPPGWPLLLALGAWWGFRGMFVVALLVHLVGGAAMARMMVRRGLPAALCAAWLFHPLFWSFSTTLMSDVPAVVLLLIAMDAWENGRTAVPALSLAYSFLVRASAPMTTAGFALAVLPQWRTRWRSLLGAGLAAVAGVGLLLLTNTIKSGHPFRTPYSAANQTLFTGSMVTDNALVYGTALFLVPPFPLLCLIGRPRRCDHWAWAALPVVAVFLFYGFRDVSPRLVENLLGGQRLILAAHAALLIATAGVWSRIPLLRSTPVLLVLGGMAVIGHQLAVEHLVQRYRPAAEAVAGCRPGAVVYNQYASRAALANDASAYYLIHAEPPAAQADVAVVALRPTTNRFATTNDYRVPAWLLANAGRCHRYGDFYVFDLAGRCSLAGDACGLTSNGEQR